MRRQSDTTGERSDAGSPDIKHISHPVPGEEGSVEMKMIWILLTIGLTFAERLDRTYLPPAGSPFSGGSPGAINVPLELPKTRYSSNDEGFLKTPELVIGINRVSPIQAIDIFGDISTQKPAITNNVNSFTSQTNTPSSIFKASSPFSKLEEDFNDFENAQQIHNIEKQPSINYDEKNRVYLPSYGGDNTDYVPFITLPPPINNDKGISDEYKYIQTDIDSNKDTPSLNPINQQFNAIFSTLSPDFPINSNRNILPFNNYSSTASEFSATTPISSMRGEAPTYNYRPERIQAEADRQAVILNYDQSITPEGYVYNYDTSNGIHGDEEGIATDGVKAKGSYSYVGDDGNLYQVEYTADENGFVPKGAHLPTAPPIPEEILKVIEQAARDKEAGVYDDGSYSEEKYGYKNYQEGYPKTNTNVINKTDFSPENERNIVIGDLFNGHQNDKINSQTVSGYEYFPPQFSFYDTNKMKPFPFRFSGIENQDLEPETKENNTEKVTAKPFLTPYVIRKGDEIEINDYDEQFENGQQDTDFDEETIRNRSKENNGDGPNDFDDQQFGNKVKYQESFEDNQNDKPINIDGEIDSREFVPGNRQQLQYGDRIPNANNNLIPSNDKGYYYQNTSKPFITLNPRVSYTTSTAASTELPAGRSEDFISTPVSGPSSFQTPSFSTTSIIDASSTNIPTSSLLMNTVKPVNLDSESTSIYPDVYSKTDSLSTPKTIQASRPKFIPGVPRFGMSYRPTTDSSKYFDIGNSQTIPEDIIGEDFSGPKQAQQFDSITGYYYK
ncbi:uncharacterized protein LOC123875825 [Maniola jurtina]|uniref:uncharacterized protein LOC123875825 n=1 Tax=Maniola jurtina TaxID=191418 RepID=UPI001E68CE63|nr:uncharacterized protein LOC123875825 [Maniola jurtina]